MVSSLLNLFEAHRAEKASTDPTRSVRPVYPSGHHYDAPSHALPPPGLIRSRAVRKNHPIAFLTSIEMPSTSFSFIGVHRVVFRFVSGALEKTPHSTPFEQNES
ncbi:unnamed protein product [Sphacelaria rigidula]